MIRKVKVSFALKNCTKVSDFIESNKLEKYFKKKNDTYYFSGTIKKQSEHMELVKQMISWKDCLIDSSSSWIDYIIDEYSEEELHISEYISLNLEKFYDIKFNFEGSNNTIIPINKILKGPDYFKFIYYPYQTEGKSIILMIKEIPKVDIFKYSGTFGAMFVSEKVKRIIDTNGIRGVNLVPVLILQAKVLHERWYMMTSSNLIETEVGNLGFDSDLSTRVIEEYVYNVSDKNKFADVNTFNFTKETGLLNTSYPYIVSNKVFNLFLNQGITGISLKKSVPIIFK